MCCDCCGRECGGSKCEQRARGRLLPDGGERDESDEEALSPADIVDDEVLDGDRSAEDTTGTPAGETKQDETADPLAGGSPASRGDQDGATDTLSGDREEVGGTDTGGDDELSGRDEDSDRGVGDGREGTPASQDDRADQPGVVEESSEHAETGHTPPPGESGVENRVSSGDQQEQLGGTEAGLVAQLKTLPWRWGGGLGGLIVGIPYVLVTLLVAVIHERNAVVGGSELNALDVGAEVFLSLISFGSPERIRDAVVSIADIDLEAIDPADYPTVQDQVGPALQFIQDAPAALLLGLYLLVPYLLVRSGAWLATEHAPSERARDHLAAALTLVVGVLPVVILVGALFTVTGFGGKLLVGGVVVPVVFGGLGGLSAWAYDESLRISGAFGVGAVAVGLVAAFVLVGRVVDRDLTLLDLLAAGLIAYLEVVQFDVSSATAARVLFAVALGALLAAGGLRAWSVRGELSAPVAGARVGASIAYGVVWVIGVLLWLVPFTLILTGEVPTPLVSALVADSGALSDSLAGYRDAIVLAGLVVPAVAGGVGGVFAALYSDRVASSEREQSNL